MYFDVRQGLRDDREVGQVEVFTGTESNRGAMLVSVAIEPQEIDADTAVPVDYRVIVTVGDRPGQPVYLNVVRREELMTG